MLLHIVPIVPKAYSRCPGLVEESNHTRRNADQYVALCSLLPLTMCQKADNSLPLLGAALGFLGLFFTASALLLMFLTFLGGARNSNPLNIIYFLEADTSAIPGAPALSRWTFWNVCPVVDGKMNCPGNTPAFPFDPPSHRNFDTTVNVPHQFIE